MQTGWNNNLGYLHQHYIANNQEPLKEEEIIEILVLLERKMPLLELMKVFLKCNYFIAGSI